jgi:hypothetical protein
LEGVLDESRATTLLGRLLQKRGQLALDDLIQYGLSRVASRVGRGAARAPAVVAIGMQAAMQRGQLAAAHRVSRSRSPSAARR